MAALFLVSSWAWNGAVLAQSDPLPSWNDGKAKTAIVEFVRRVTREGGPDFVKPAARIATFDNDGTLWAEQPVYFQLQFAFDEVKRLAPLYPEWKSKEPYRSFPASVRLRRGEAARSPVSGVEEQGTLQV
ncbi:hypothetical protein AB4Y92_25635, partial [Lysobacter sp. TAB13]